MGEVRLVPFVLHRVESISQKGADVINASDMWDTTNGNCVVAIIDTGIDVDHKDLKNHIVGGYNFTWDYNRNKTNYDDNNGHGTHVAGIVTSVAPEVKILALKALDGQGIGLTPWIWDALDYALSWRGPKGEKVRIISMSLSSSEDDQYYHDKIKNAISKGIIVACAAGNAGDNSPDTDELAYPGAWQEVVCIGACDNDGIPAFFSNSNDEIDCVAPGVYINSTYNNGGYAVMSGTSMATPHISGALALIITAKEKELGRELKEPEIFELLMKCTRPLGYHRKLEGSGIIDLSKYKSLGGDEIVESLIIYYGPADLTAAVLLKDFLNCPIIDRESYLIKPVNARKIYVIGGSWKPTSDTILLSGSDRFKTMEAVLNFIKR